MTYSTLLCLGSFSNKSFNGYYLGLNSAGNAYCRRDGKL